MKIPVRTSIAVGLALVAGFSFLAMSPAHGQINYQGRVTDNAGVPLPDGPTTMTFSLWDMASGGMQLWGPYILDGGGGDGHGPQADLVDSGRFNVIVGPLDTDGDSLTEALSTAATHYLQIQVGTDPAISPRQLILPAPRALIADVIPNVTPVGANVGIGTGAPAARLHVFNGSSGQSLNSLADFVLEDDSNSYLQINSPDNSLAGLVFGRESSSDHGGVLYSPSESIIFRTDNDNRMVINRSGDVGIGADAPGARLDVRGDIKLGPTGQYFAAAAEENLRIVRGIVLLSGPVSGQVGPGYSVPTHSTTSTITFDQPFSGPPIITATAADTNQAFHTTVANVTTSGFNISTWNRSDNGQRTSFHFIAIGPR